MAPGAVTTPGTYPDLPMRDYLAIDAVSSSFLRKIEETCPALALWEQVHPKAETEAMARGTAVHMRVLEPETFDARYCIVDGNRNSNAVKDAIAKAKAEGKTALRSQGYEQIVAMAHAVRTHERASAILDQATFTELSVVWIDAETGLRCKARLDVACEPEQAVYDLKTTRDANPRGWSKTMLDGLMHMQAAHHLNGAVAAGLDVQGFGWIALESNRPYPVVVQPPLDVESMAVGQMLVRDALRTVKTCRERDFWPSYTQPEEASYLPEWYVSRHLAAEGVAV